MGKFEIKIFNMKAKKKVLIVDNHAVLRQGISNYINKMDDLVICGEADNAESAIKSIVDCKPDVVIVSIALKGTNGIELTKAIKHRFNIPVLILTMFDETIYAERALRAGAMGYIMKNETIEKVIEALRDIINGKMYLAPDLKEKFLKKFVCGFNDINRSTVDMLTNREFEVFRYTGKGYCSRHIAHAMALSPKTIETYRDRIKKKLKLKNSFELSKYAIEWFSKRDNI